MTALHALACVATGLAAGLLCRAVVPVVDWLAGWAVADLTPRLAAAYADVARAKVYLRVWAIALFAVPLAVAFAFGLPVFAVVLVIPLLFVPRLVVASMGRRQRVKLRDQLVSGCMNLANTTRAGLSFVQGLENVLPDTPEPLAFEFRRILHEVRRGRTLNDALVDAEARMRLEPFTLFSAAVRACVRQGGNLSEAMDRIGVSLLENQRLERKVESETAAGQRAVQVLAACPPAFLVMFALVDPEAVATYATLPGQMVLAVVFGLTVVAVWWARAILQPNRAAK